MIFVPRRFGRELLKVLSYNRKFTLLQFFAVTFVNFTNGAFNRFDVILLNISFKGGQQVKELLIFRNFLRLKSVRACIISIISPINVFYFKISQGEVALNEAINAIFERCIRLRRDVYVTSSEHD